MNDVKASHFLGEYLQAEKVQTFSGNEDDGVIIINDAPSQEDLDRREAVDLLLQATDNSNKEGIDKAIDRLKKIKGEEG